MSNLWQIIDIVLKLILAVLCGGLVGLIKGGNRNTISFSSLILVCFTATLLVLLILKLNIPVNNLETGLAAIILSFAIISGSIIIGKKASISSILNGVTILAVSGMGIAIGSGNFIVAILAGLLMSVILNIIYNKFLVNSD